MPSRAATSADPADWIESALALIFLIVGVVLVVWWTIVGAAAHPIVMVAAATFTAWILWYWNPLHGVGALVLLTVFQNWGVSIASPLIADQSTFQVLQGTNFAVVAVLAASAWFGMNAAGERASSNVQWVRRWVLVSTVLIALYSLYGATQASLTSVAIYFRYTVTGIAGLAVGVEAGRIGGSKGVLRAMVAVACLSALLLIPELLFSEQYFRSIGAPEFFTLKYGETYTEQGVIELVTRRFFNLPIEVDAVSRRLMASVMHQVSYGYVLFAGAVAALALGHSIIGVLLCTLTFFAGVKGPLIALLVVLGVLCWRRIVGRGVGLILLVVGLAYVVGGVAVGLFLQDQHAVGFYAGLQSLLTAPFGNGIGVGGNLSDAVRDLGGADWDRWRSRGAPFALESAIGVLLYQMGVVGFPVLNVFVGAVRRALKSRTQTRLGVITGAALAAVVANGVFQEEAFSPYAIGFACIMAGAVIGAEDAGDVVTAEGA